MPLQVEQTYDVLTPMIKFETSTVFEMLSSLEVVLDSHWHPDWTDTVREVLGDSFVEELADLYSDFSGGLIISELGVDAPDPNDVPGFLDHVASMSERRFVFFLLGRLCPEEKIPVPYSQEKARAYLDAQGDEVCVQYVVGASQWADDPLAFRDRLLTVWRTYWDGLFSRHVMDHVACCSASIREKQVALTEHGGTALYEQVTGWRKLPDELPPGQPFKDIRLIPAYRINCKRRVYFGYGQVTVVYDCSRTEQREHDIIEGKNRAVETMRALADETRLSLLKLIAEHEQSANGRKIAEHLGLSASVVSRHLKQLRDAGLVEEHSPDNRNITYRLVMTRINELADNITRYIKD